MGINIRLTGDILRVLATEMEGRPVKYCGPLIATVFESDPEMVRISGCPFGRPIDLYREDLPEFFQELEKRGFFLS